MDDILIVYLYGFHCCYWVAVVLLGRIIESLLIYKLVFIVPWEEWDTGQFMIQSVLKTKSALCVPMFLAIYDTFHSSQNKVWLLVAMFIGNSKVLFLASKWPFQNIPILCINVWHLVWSLFMGDVDLEYRCVISLVLKCPALSWSKCSEGELVERSNFMRLQWCFWWKPLSVPKSLIEAKGLEEEEVAIVLSEILWTVSFIKLFQRFVLNHIISRFFLPYWLSQLGLVGSLTPPDLHHSHFLSISLPPLYPSKLCIMSIFLHTSPSKPFMTM